MATITGSTGADLINSGTPQADSISGLGGNDTIIGGGGEDNVDGGDGIDTYDLTGQAAVKVFFSDVAQYSLFVDRFQGNPKRDSLTSIERLILTANNDQVTGSSFGDYADGGAGNDTMTGNGGNDTLRGGTGLDSLDGGDASDQLNGGDGNDTLIGGAGNDFLAPGIGTNNVQGGLDYDTVIYTNLLAGLNVTMNSTIPGSATTTGGATDTLTGIEEFRLTTGADTFTGGAGDDVVDGWGGNDSLLGGAGNDTFILGFNQGVDTINGGDGTDTISARANSVAINWANVTGIEAVDATGKSNVQIKGDATANTLDFTTVTLTNIARIDGGAGNDLITGSTGGDTISGGSGTDTINGGDGNDVILMAAGGGLDSINGGNGVDTIRAETVNVKIDWTKVSNVEAVDGAGKADVRLTGTIAADTLDFDGVTLTGIAYIDGGSGADTITGSTGDDKIFGGAAADLLSGNGGNDTFAFHSASDSGRGTRADHITDFNAGDKIDLSEVDGDTLAVGRQAFHFVVGGFTGAAGELYYETALGVTTVYGDLNGDMTADFQIVLDNGYGLVDTDFTL